MLKPVTPFAESVSSAMVAHRAGDLTVSDRDDAQGDTPPDAWMRANYKRYPRLPSVDISKLDAPVARAARVSVRDFDERPVRIEDLSKILHAAAAIYSITPPLHRPLPSAGARWPIEVYLFAWCVEGIPRGLYHYGAADDRLVILLDEANLPNPVELVGESCTNPPCLAILTGVMHRSTVKYGGRGYRYVLMEAGAFAGRIDDVAVDCGLGTLWIGGFDDGQVASMIDASWNLEEEAPLLLLALGYAVE